MGWHEKRRQKRVRKSHVGIGLFQCATLNENSLTTKKGSAELSLPFMMRTGHKVCCTFPEKEVILQLREYNAWRRCNLRILLWRCVCVKIFQSLVITLCGMISVALLLSVTICSKTIYCTPLKCTK
jgi:hypothetical protein